MAVAGMERIYQNVGRRVAQRRKELGWSQTELAEEIGSTLHIIANLETGRQRIHLHVAADIATALGVDLAWLLHSQEGQRRDFIHVEWPPHFINGR